MSKKEISPRLEQLRKHLSAKDIDAYYVPRADQFQNEYVPPCNNRLARITNFSGSAGSAIVAKDRAAFFTDGRYTLQAQDEVPSEQFEIYSISPNQAPTPTLQLKEWIETKLEKGARVGFDPMVVTPMEYDRLHAAVAKVGGTLVPVSDNLIDQDWSDRPAEPKKSVTIQPVTYAGEDHQKKITRMAKALRDQHTCALAITFPEEIAWLLNIRGSDVDYNPLPLSYAILYVSGEVDLFIDADKISESIKSHLGENVKVHSFEDFEDALHDLRGDANKVWIDPKTAPFAVKNTLARDHMGIHEAQSPIQMAKAVKNKAEIKGMTAAHIRDGAALTRYLYRLSQDNFIQNNSEISASNTLKKLREEQEGFKDLSFDTISGAGPAGAIIHYRSTADSDKPLQSGAIYLCDSGAQYQDGTTDVTRTVAVDQPSPEMIENFTRVLKGHIQVAMSVFPKGTNGKPLDAKARAALKEVGLDFTHGTGHGRCPGLHPPTHIPFRR